MREIVLDTETTGLDAREHRLIEVACVELVNHLPSGRTFQRYVNPERSVPEDAARIHGLRDEFLADKPRFAEIADDLIAFIGDAPLVIHNAAFDLGFLAAEFARVDKPAIAESRAIDTVTLARKRFPGQPASLDALCQRFGIDNAHRTLHGALLDAELLAEVYIELIGGRQASMALGLRGAAIAAGTVRAIRPPRAHAPSPAEEAAHAELLKTLKDPIWLRA